MLPSRIVGVCAAYAAMTASRPHRPARGHADACAELGRAAGSQCDPRVVDACLALDRDAARPSARDAVDPVDDVALRLEALLDRGPSRRFGRAPAEARPAV